MTHVLLISSKPMIDPRRHNHQIPLLQPNPHPIVLLAPDIKISSATEDKPDLLVLMQMLREEGLDFLFIPGE